MGAARWAVMAVVAVAAAGEVACAARGEFPSGPPRPDLARQLEKATALDRPLRVEFHWTAQEGDARFRGEGVARLQPPYLARLDLFGPRGEGYLSAAVDGAELTLPRGADAGLLPPVALLWTLFGVFLEPERFTLQATDHDGVTELGYLSDSESLRFSFRGDTLRFAERMVGRGHRETVEITATGTFGRPEAVLYRDWSAFRELSIEVVDIDEVAPFPSDIWTLGAR